MNLACDRSLVDDKVFSAAYLAERDSKFKTRQSSNELLVGTVQDHSGKVQRTEGADASGCQSTADVMSWPKIRGKGGEQ